MSRRDAATHCHTSTLHTLSHFNTAHCNIAKVQHNAQYVVARHCSVFVAPQHLVALLHWHTVLNMSQHDTATTHCHTATVHTATLRIDTQSSVCSGTTLKHMATVAHCNTLQHTATHCNTLQHAATHCNTLQHAATHCNTLQHTATHCNTLQHTATHCNTLQHTATHCNTLQHTATHFN